MTEKNKTLSLLDLKGNISFDDGYDYRKLRTLTFYKVKNENEYGVVMCNSLEFRKLYKQNLSN